MKKIILIAAICAICTQAHSQWSLTGNAGTNASTNFIGTTDNIAFKIRTNNAVRLTVSSGGKVGIGITSPAWKLDVKGGSINTDSTYLVKGIQALARSGSGNLLLGIVTNYVGIGTATPVAGYSLTVGTNGGTKNGINVEDPVDAYILYCLKTGSGPGIYVNKNWSGGGSPTVTAAIEAHVNANNYAVEGYHTGGSYGALGGSNGVLGTSGTSYGLMGSSNLSGTAVGAFNLGTGSAVIANASTGTAITGTTGGVLAASFTTNYSGIAYGVKGLFTGTGSFDGVGVYGEALNANTNYGIGGSFYGKFYGVLGTGYAGGAAAIYAYSSGASNAIYCNGNFAGTGINSYSSDGKLKKDIIPIENALEQVMKLKPSVYQFRSGEFGDMFLPSGNHYGVIAQDLQKVFPELVVEQKFYNNDKSSFDYLAVNYQELTPILIAAVQKQQQQIEAKDKSINDLQNQLNEMQQCVQSLCDNSSLKGSSSAVATESKLMQNQPNPFDQTTVIRFALSAEHTSGVIIIRDLSGNTVKSIAVNNTGKGQVTINANEFTQGTYTYSLEIAGESVDTKLMVITK